ncbi:periplasmic protease [Cupriavidus gilardii CR3]|uniref:Probable periplasmic serine endoprotease DegP-like n=1 Tax=Cupriavidus gilardii TaxID=82541 RepID=A0A849BIU2_9BURK|nr:DegQ family serine endoprotease [Cupriavidus gilardii]ALD93650.1 periplasmic protease [Cupriavidus gilardii CR3]KAB0594070.1 DegQ family serine endoprotease [Cupriavidus gilardii]MCT9016815.1 DegQ family serine endoprotease [Cupriavidus gilardii]MCT9056462.1 DegQ family serine endoprotease [Cupriavidus gilardii]NNH14226.1 DegQ family serine endoprotease [Cupriavidus gilardii]
MIRRTVARTAIAIAAVGVLAGGYNYLQKEAVSSSYAAPTPVVAQVSAAPGRAMATPTDFSGIVDRYGPAVVNISVTARAQRTAAQMPPGMDPDDPMFQFFKRFGIPFPYGPQPDQPQLARGLGSGFIVSPDGMILTNAHVVDGAQEVVVKLTDRREFKAKVLGVDKQTDIAVIKIDAKDLPTVQLGDPSQVRVGEPVVAIGSPYGFENTVTAGIVSAKSRALPDDTYVPFIQTDVAVNPGNSGGPLFNQRGEVIGINSQIYSRTGGYQGLSFAIPIDVATKVQQQLVAHGKVTRGRLGIGVQEVNQALAQSFGLPKPAGALVNTVEPDGPAAKAGLKPGDVIVQIGDDTVDRSTDLPEHVADLKPGTETTLKVVREGKPVTLTVKVGAANEQSVAQKSEGAESGGKLGLAVRPLSPAEQRESGIAGGLVVEGASGPAARVGIQPGDVILAFNGTPIKSVEQLRTMVSKAGKEVALLVQRDDTQLFVPIELG